MTWVEGDDLGHDSGVNSGVKDASTNNGGIPDTESVSSFDGSKNRKRRKRKAGKRGQGKRGGGAGSGTETDNSVSNPVQGGGVKDDENVGARNSEERKRDDSRRGNRRGNDRRGRGGYSDRGGRQNGHSENKPVNPAAAATEGGNPKPQRENRRDNRPPRDTKKEPTEKASTDKPEQMVNGQ